MYTIIVILYMPLSIINLIPLIVSKLIEDKLANTIDMLANIE